MILSIARAARATLAMATIAVLAACGSEPVSAVDGALASNAVAPGDPHTAFSRGVSVNRDLAALRRATARFHDAEAAAAAGYSILVTHPTTGAACLDHPTDGGMGRHMLNPALVDDAVSATEPEVIVYEPQKDGGLRLVGVEYIIPYAIRGPEEAPPTLFGQEFLHNPTFGLWMLHVYAWKHNPAGIFATWNSAITCEFDGAVG